MSPGAPVPKDAGKLEIFHDIGKKDVPLDVLNKSGALTDAEWKVMGEPGVASDSTCRPRSAW